MTSNPETTTSPKRRLARLILLIPLLAITAIAPSACYYYDDYYGHRGGYGYGGRNPVAESYERGYRGDYGWGGRRPAQEAYERSYGGYGRYRYYGGWEGRGYRDHDDDDWGRGRYWH